MSWLRREVTGGTYSCPVEIVFRQRSERFFFGWLSVFHNRTGTDKREKERRVALSAAFLFLLRSSCYLLLPEAREMVRYGCMSVGLAVGWMFYSVLLRCAGRGEGQSVLPALECQVGFGSSN